MKLIKILVLCILVMVSFLFVYKFFINDSKSDIKDVYLFDMEQFKNLEKNSIESITVIKYTEGGDNSKEINNSNEIVSLYDNFSKIKLVKETNMTCTDNITVYKFNMKDKTSINLEFECDWIVLGKDRYLIK